MASLPDDLRIEQHRQRVHYILPPIPPEFSISGNNATERAGAAFIIALMLAWPTICLFSLPVIVPDLRLPWHGNNLAFAIWFAKALCTAFLLLMGLGSVWFCISTFHPTRQMAILTPRGLGVRYYYWPFRYMRRMPWTFHASLIIHAGARPRHDPLTRHPLVYLTIKGPPLDRQPVRIGPAPRAVLTPLAHDLARGLRAYSSDAAISRRDRSGSEVALLPNVVDTTDPELLQSDDLARPPASARVRLAHHRRY